MNFLSLTAVCALLLSGCSYNNAFTKFHMQKEQELSVSSLQSSKIVSKNNQIEGVLSAIYLNEVYPKSFNQNEYFYVSIYLKDKKEIYDPNTNEDVALTLVLNGELPVKIKKLPSQNQFSHLLSRTNKWNIYYLVAFKKQGNTLHLLLKGKDLSSSALVYYKDEQ